MNIPTRMRALAVLAILTGAPAMAADRLQDDLEKHFQQSRIEVQSPKHRGAVTPTGRVFVIALDGVTAKPFRVAQANTKSPAFHVMDYARVDVTADGRVAAEPAERVLPRGTRMVILSTRLRGDRLYLQTHTEAPTQRLADGGEVFGCTEFVFALGPDVVSHRDASAIVTAVERWLASTNR